MYQGRIDEVGDIGNVLKKINFILEKWEQSNKHKIVGKIIGLIKVKSERWFGV